MTVDEARAKLAARLAEIDAEYRRRIELPDAWRGEARPTARRRAPSKEIDHA